MNVETSIRTVEDARRLAERRLPKGLYQSFEGGSGSRITNSRNIAAFEQVMFRPRVAVFAKQRHLSRVVLGHELNMPVIASSVGLLGLAHPDGEAGVARACGAAGTVQFVSGATATPIEEVVAASTGPVYFQLYYFRGREASAAIIERARRAGCSGIVLTVDSPAPMTAVDRPPGQRADVPRGFGTRQLLRFAPQMLARPRWTFDFIRHSRGRPPQMAMALGDDGRVLPFYAALAALYQEPPTWNDIAWIREQWDCPIIVKGVVTADDARRAVDAGAAAVVVSNHGGQALDGTLPTLAALPKVVAAVGDQAEVLLDSGVRRGVDVVKALAMGARAVLLGRAYVFPLLAAGEPGVRQILEVFRREIDFSLANLGCSSIDDLDPSFLALPEEWQPRSRSV